MNTAMNLSTIEHHDQGREYFENILFFLDSEESHEMKLSDLEQELEKRGRELMRLLLQEHLDRLSPSICEQTVLGSDDIERPNKREHERHVATVFGPVSSNRVGYNSRSEGGESLHPLDAHLNFPSELYSLELRRRVAENAAKNSFDETVDTIGKTTGTKIPKRQVEELTQRAAQDFDDFYETYRKPENHENTGSVLVVSADGKGVPMHKQDLREQTRNAAERQEHQMKTRLSQGEKSNRKRMATVAAVYTTEPVPRSVDDIIGDKKAQKQKENMPLPEHKRVWAGLKKPAEEIIGSAFQEASRRDPNGEKQWVALVDGENNQLRILQKMACQQGVDVIIIVDIIHVIEYLWKAGRAFHPKSGPDLEAWVQHRLYNILQGKAGLMAGGMRRSATRKKPTEKQREPVEKCATYLKNKAPFLKYNQYLEKGLPIATGVIEGACRHLVKDRMEITGAKWCLTSAEAVLKLRALRSSNDFDAYWKFHEQCEHKRNHQSKFADGEVPEIKFPQTLSKGSHLRIIDGGKK